MNRDPRLRAGRFGEARPGLPAFPPPREALRRGCCGRKPKAAVRQRDRTQRHADPENAVQEEDPFLRDQTRVALQRCPCLHFPQDADEPDHVDELGEFPHLKVVPDHRPDQEREDEEEHARRVGGDGATLAERRPELDCRRDERGRQQNQEVGGEMPGWHVWTNQFGLARKQQ